MSDTITLNVYDQKGKATGKMEINPADLGGHVKTRLLKTVVTIYEDNQRNGTAHTLTRSEVSGTRRKLYRQKGTGRARAGNRRAGNRVGGGVIHGPRNKVNWKRDLPRRTKRVALASALLAKAQDGQITVFNDLQSKETKTKPWAQLLTKMELKGSKLFGLGPDQEKTALSVRNIDRVKVEESRNLSALDVLQSRHLIIDQNSLNDLLSRAKSAVGRGQRGGDN